MADVPSFEEVCSILVKEPFNLTMRQIGELTDYQLIHIYFRPKETPAREVKQGLPYREVFRRHWSRQGLTDAEILARWIADGNKESDWTSSERWLGDDLD